MGRIARALDSAKIERLRRNIADPHYVDAAIERLAASLTNEIIDAPEQNVAHRYRSTNRSSSLAALLRTASE